MAIVDDAGAVQNSYTYDVYGEPSVTGSLANEFDFAGQQTDGDTGLQYVRARYMDPETGVFLSRDPLAAMPSWLGSHFGYASGNPATATDPTGLCDDGSPACLGTESPTPPAPDGWHFWAWVGLEDPGPLMWLEWKQSGIGPYVRLCRLVGEYRECGAEILYEKARKASLAEDILDLVDHLTSLLTFAGTHKLGTSRSQCVAKRYGYETVEDFKADYLLGQSQVSGMGSFDLHFDESTGKGVLYNKTTGTVVEDTEFDLRGCR